jgi:hypothetical protein
LERLILNSIFARNYICEFIYDVNEICHKIMALLESLDVKPTWT